MRTALHTWVEAKLVYGDWYARQHLGWVSKRKKFLPDNKRDPLALVMELVSSWPGSTPAEIRMKFAPVIKSLVKRAREDRLRVLGYCAPGVPRTFLP